MWVKGGFVMVVMVHRVQRKAGGVRRVREEAVEGKREEARLA